jgi:hypothetical protein
MLQLGDSVKPSIAKYTGVIDDSLEVVVLTSSVASFELSLELSEPKVALKP